MKRRVIATNYDPTAVRAPRLSESFRSQLYTVLQSMRGRPLARCIRELRKRELLSQIDFDELHRQRLERILDHARSQVPLYGSGPWRNVSNSPEMFLDNWPVLEKSVLQAHYEELLAAKQPPKTETLSTSGTTGKPTRVASDYLASTYGWAHRYRALQWHGIPIGPRSLRLSHDRRPLRDRILGQKCVWPLDTDDSVNEAMDYLVDKRPMLVAGTPSAVFYLARRLQERGFTAPLAPFARVGGEQLFSFQRKHIESYLCGRAIDSYGTTETGALAGECPAGSMHVYAGHVHLEIFRDDAPAPPGEFGDIVVTTLNNLAMPLIRYKVGDRGRLSLDKCSCGLPYPVLTELQARSGDNLVMADGSLRHSSVLVEQLQAVFDDTRDDFVRQLQFGQNNPDSWEVWVEGSESIVAKRGNSADTADIENTITGILHRTVGAKCNVAIHFVSQMPREHGKFRYFLAARSTRRAAQAAP